MSDGALNLWRPALSLWAGVRIELNSGTAGCRRVVCWSVPPSHWNWVQEPKKRCLAIFVGGAGTLVLTLL